MYQELLNARTSALLRWESRGELGELLVQLGERLPGVADSIAYFDQLVTKSLRTPDRLAIDDHRPCVRVDPHPPLICEQANSFADGIGRCAEFGRQLPVAGEPSVGGVPARVNSAP